jgi:predicted nucleotidyltransferase
VGGVLGKSGEALAHIGDHWRTLKHIGRHWETLAPHWIPLENHTTRLEKLMGEDLLLTECWNRVLAGLADFSVEMLGETGGTLMSNQQGLPALLQPAIGALLEELKQEIGESLLGVWLFGSQARGDAEPDSDIDLLILVSSATWPMRQRIYAIAGAIGLKHTLLFNTLVWDPAHGERHRLAETPIWTSLSQEGILLWTS